MDNSSEPNLTPDAIQRTPAAINGLTSLTPDPSQVLDALPPTVHQRTVLVATLRPCLKMDTPLPSITYCTSLLFVKLWICRAFTISCCILFCSVFLLFNWKWNMYLKTSEIIKNRHEKQHWKYSWRFLNNTRGYLGSKHKVLGYLASKKTKCWSS